MSERDTILTAAEVEALVAEYPKIYVEHTTACWQWHPECALARLAASHLALLREVRGGQEWMWNGFMEPPKKE